MTGEFFHVGNDDGFFLFTNVLAGDYRITAEGGGFKKTEVSNVKAAVSIPATVSLVMETGQISETVQTTAGDSQAVINTENAELSTVVTEKQINDLRGNATPGAHYDSTRLAAGGHRQRRRQSAK